MIRPVEDCVGTSGGNLGILEAPLLLATPSSSAHSLGG